MGGVNFVSQLNVVSLGLLLLRVSQAQKLWKVGKDSHQDEPYAPRPGPGGGAGGGGGGRGFALQVSSTWQSSVTFHCKGSTKCGPGSAEQTCPPSGRHLVARWGGSRRWGWAASDYRPLRLGPHHGRDCGDARGVRRARHLRRCYSQGWIDSRGCRSLFCSCTGTEVDCIAVAPSGTRRS